MTISIMITSLRQAVPATGVLAVTENNDITVEFAFAENSGFDVNALKTAVFVTQRGKQEVAFTGSVCTAPLFCKEDGRSVRIGLTQGTIHTTTPATVLLSHSILAQAGAAAPSVPVSTETVDSVDAADIINVNDVSAGAWVRATINTLAACIAQLIGGGGGGGGDSYWTLLEGILSPVAGVTGLAGIGSMAFADGGEPWRIIVMEGEPNINTLPVYGVGTIVQDGSTGTYYINAGSEPVAGGTHQIWHEVVLDIDSHEFNRGATYVVCEQLPATATWREYIQRLTGWYAEIAKIADKQDALTAGNGITIGLVNNLLTIAADLASSVTDNGTKAPTAAAVAAYVAAQLAALTYYTKPAGGIPDSDLSRDVQATLLLAGSAYQMPAGGIPGTDLAPGVIPDVSNLAPKVAQVVVATDGAVSQELSPNTVYVFTGALTSLTLTLGTPAANVASIYQVFFVNGATAVTLSLPAAVDMGNFVPAANTVSELNIQYTGISGSEYIGRGDNR